MAKKINKIEGLLNPIEEIIKEVFTTDAPEATEEPSVEAESTPEVTAEPEKKGGEIPPVRPYHFFVRHFRADDLLTQEEKAELARLKVLFEGLEGTWATSQFDGTKGALPAFRKENNAIAKKVSAMAGNTTIAAIVPITEGAWEGATQSLLSDKLGVSPSELYNGLIIAHWGIEFPKFPKGIKGKKEDVAKCRVLYDKIKDGYETALLYALLRANITIKGGDDKEHRYIFFTSSPGQMKKDCGVFIDSAIAAAMPHLMWPMGPQKINEIVSLRGGKNIIANKYLQYRALLMSSAVPSGDICTSPIKLKEVICVPSSKKSMEADVRSVSVNYVVTDGVREDIENPLFDGEALLNAACFPEFAGQVALQIRAYWACKGLAVSMDIAGYCNANGYGHTVTDVDGVIHDVTKETIKMIVSTDVWKTSKVFHSWAEYVSTAEACGCDEIYVTATNSEEGGYKTLSNQMTQSLFDCSTRELAKLSRKTIKKLQSYQTIEGAYRALTAPKKVQEEKTGLECLVEAYPETIDTLSARDALKDREASRYIEAATGKLAVKAKYAFIAQDPCAWIDILFGGFSPDDPKLGVVKANHIICGLQPNNVEEVDVLRSPHSGFEHAIMKTQEGDRFLTETNILFSSAHDLLYRRLQCDYDGDHVLVCWDGNTVQIAKAIYKKYPALTKVVYYEPDKAASAMPIPETRKGFAGWACHALRVASRTNMVGLESTNVKKIFSKGGQIFSVKVNGEETVINYDYGKMMADVAVYSAAVNHAVDAAKVGAFTAPDEGLTPALQGNNPHVMFYQKEREAIRSYIKGGVSFDDYEGKEANYCQKGTGTLDRVAKIIERQYDPTRRLDTTGIPFKWGMLQNRVEKYNTVINKQILSANVLNLLLAFGPVKEGDDSYLGKKLNDAKAGRPIGLPEFIDVLMWQNAAYFNKKKEDAANEPDGNDGYSSKKEKSFDQKARVIFAKKLVLAYMRGWKEAVHYNDEELLVTAANIALRGTWKKACNAFAEAERSAEVQPLTPEERLDMSEKDIVVRFNNIVTLFGDIYAENVIENRKEGYEPSGRFDWYYTSKGRSESGVGGYVEQAPAYTVEELERLFQNAPSEEDDGYWNGPDEDESPDTVE